MSEIEHMRGRVTIPTDVDVVPETLELLAPLGRGRHPRLRRHRLPRGAQERGRQGLLHLLHHPQGQRLGQGQPGRGAAVLHHRPASTPPSGGPLSIPLMQGISRELMQVNTRDDIKRWWEVMDRTTGRAAGPRRLAL